MILIEIDGKTPPQKWLTKAKKTTKKLLAAKDDASRTALIKKHSSLWRQKSCKNFSCRYRMENAGIRKQKNCAPSGMWIIFVQKDEHSLSIVQKEQDTGG